MLTGIIADIHGNYQALTAILDAFDRLAVDSIYCAGDVIGYGASPGLCVDELRKREIPCVMGNHDSYLSAKDIMAIPCVRREAKETLAWTYNQLTEEQRNWLYALPQVIRTEDFMVTHASCQPFPRWCYVTTPNAALLHLLFQPQQLCFTGHSHVPVVAQKMPRSAVTLGFLGSGMLPKKGLVMVGVGAVGQPRDEDPRASAVLYNTSSGKLNLLRVKYDVRAAQQEILSNNLPSILASRLEVGQ